MRRRQILFVFCAIANTQAFTPRPWHPNLCLEAPILKGIERQHRDWRRVINEFVLGLSVTTIVFVLPAHATTTHTTYDGFAEYAKQNKMEKSDVACFVKQCGDQTKALFRNPRGIKGVSCLGRCKGEQACATRCFAEFNSDDLNSWLSCTIEEHECVKVPKTIDNSAENKGYDTVVEKFDQASLIGKWYKTDGLNPQVRSRTRPFGVM